MILTVHIPINKGVRMITQTHACAHKTHTQREYNQTKQLQHFPTLRYSSNSVPQLPHMINLYFILLIHFLFTKTSPLDKHFTPLMLSFCWEILCQC